MTGSRKVLLVIVALAVPAYFLPATRDEISWWWTELHAHSDNYLRYLSDWPHGRHVVEARLLCEERRRVEAAKAEIADLMTSKPSATNSDVDVAYRREQETRRDNFLWKKATGADTVESYQNYLSQYPGGLHAGEGRQRIEALGQPAPQTNTTTQ